MPDDHAEILRLRERVHKITSDVAANRVTLQAMVLRLDKLTSAVEVMAQEDAIAKAVTERMKRERAEMFSRPAKVAAFIVSVCAIAGFVLQLTGST